MKNGSEEPGEDNKNQNSKIVTKWQKGYIVDFTIKYCEIGSVLTQI